MSLTTRERGAYTGWGERGWGVGRLIFGWAYIQVEKRVTNLGDLYSGELINGGSYLWNFTETLLLDPGIYLYFSNANHNNHL